MTQNTDETTANLQYAAHFWGRMGARDGSHTTYIVVTTDLRRCLMQDGEVMIVGSACPEQFLTAAEATAACLRISAEFGNWDGITFTVVDHFDLYKKHAEWAQQALDTANLARALVKAREDA